MEFKQYEAAQRKVALADLSAWGKLSFRGPDCKKFLHGLLTNDIQSLKPNHGLASCILTPKGKLIADFALYDLGEELLSVQPPQATAGILAALSKPLILSQTTIQDVSSRWASFLIIGPETRHILEAALGISEPPAHYACARLACAAAAPPVAPAAAESITKAAPFSDQDGDTVLALSYPAFGPEGILLLVSMDRAKEFQSNLIERGRAFGLERMGPEILEILRVEAGVPALGVDTDDDTLPLELPLEHAISFMKGCYMGQETTARIKNLGHVNRKLAGLKLQEPASPWAEVFFQEKQIGKITSIVESPKLGAFLALGLIRHECSEPGARVVVMERGRALDAEVVSLPLA